MERDVVGMWKAGRIMIVDFRLTIIFHRRARKGRREKTFFVVKEKYSSKPVPSTGYQVPPPLSLTQLR